MRLGKTFVSAVAVLGAMLSVGPGFAQATTTVELCKAYETPCAEANEYEINVGIQATSSKVEFIGENATVTCEKSTIKGEAMGAAGHPLMFYIESMTFTSCTSGKTACTVSGLHLPYYGELEQSAEGKNAGTFKLTDWGNGSASTSISCSKIVECTLSQETVSLEVTGGASATIKAAKSKLEKVSGELCLKSPTLTATYTVESPAPMNLTARGTKVCTTTANASNECNIVYGGSHKAELISASAKFPTSLGVVSCSEITHLSEYFSDGTGKITLMHAESAGLCSSTINAPSNPGVEVTLEGLPYLGSSYTFRSFTAPNKAVLTAGGQPVLKLKIELPTSLTCLYSARQANWVVTAYSPLKIKAQWYWIIQAGNPGGCPGNAQLEAELSMKRATDNGNMWITR